jgi:hypothetical protein
MAGSPDPAFAGGIFIPLSRYPYGVCPRAHFPMAGSPDPMIIDVCPVALDPDMRGARPDGFHLNARWRRRFGDHRRARGSGRRDRFVRGHDHGLCMVRHASAEHDARDYRQNTQCYFFHNFPLLGRRRQPWFCAIPRDGLKHYILGGGEEQVGRFATQRRGRQGEQPMWAELWTSKVSVLRFSGVGLFSVYADIRVSL